MAKFDALHIEWSRTNAFCFLENSVSGHEVKLRVLVHELPDEPWARDAVHFHSFTSNPFHW